MRFIPDPLKPLTKYAQFVLYKLVPKANGKTDKIPIDPFTLRAFEPGARWQQNQAAWTSADNACFLASNMGPDYGVGFLFTEKDPFFFIDIDACLGPDNKWTPKAVDLMSHFPGAAIEVSQSGRGLHIFGKYSGGIPEHSKQPPGNDLGLYFDKRFVALTGSGVVGSAATDCTAFLPAVIQKYYPPKTFNSALVWTSEAAPEYTGPDDDDELIRKMLKSRSAGSLFSGEDKIKAIWNADSEQLGAWYPDPNRPYDCNAADMALAQYLAFWTGKNCDRIRALMKRSALVRDKWNREDYLIRTITNAVALQGAVYSTLPKLTGSPTDVQQAEAIRLTKLTECGDDKTLRAELLRLKSSKLWLSLKDKTPEQIIEAQKPVDKAVNPIAETLEPQLVTGYQYLSETAQLEHFKKCVYIQQVHKVFTPSGALLKSEQFNATYGGYIFQLDHSGEKTTKKAFEAFTESQAIRFPKVELMCFKPLVESGTIVKQDGKVAVNVYVPLTVRRMVGDPMPFLNHLRLVLPDENDRVIFLSYMAACVQYKGNKFQWAPLLQGAPGNGKTLFSKCVAAAIGEEHVHFPPASEIGEKYNAWLFGNLFIGVEDIYVPNQKQEVIEIIKPMITNDRLAKRAMHTDQVMYDVCCNFIFNSNHKDAIRKTLDDRRFSVFFTAQQSAEDIKRCGMGGDYFPNLYKWLRSGGFAIVTDYLYSYQIPKQYNPATSCHRAPDTSTTAEVLNASMGGIEQEILEAVDEGRPGFAGGWISSMALDQLLKLKRRDGAIPINKRRDILKSLGFDWHPGLRQGRVNNIVLPDGGKPRLFIQKDHPAMGLTIAAEIAKAYETAQTEANNIGEVFKHANR